MSNDTNTSSAREAGAVEPVAWCDPAEPFNEVAFAWPGNDREARHTDPLYPQSAIDTLRAQLEAAEAHITRLDAGFVCAHAQLVARAEAAEADAARNAIDAERLYEIANHFDSMRKGLPEEWQDFAVEISDDLRRLIAARKQAAP